MATLAGWGMILRLSSSGAGLLPTVRFLVDGCPGSARGLILRCAASLVAFLDMLGHALLLIGIARLVSAWHGILHFRIERSEFDIVPKRLYSGDGHTRSFRRHDQAETFPNVRLGQTRRKSRPPVQRLDRRQVCFSDTPDAPAISRKDSSTTSLHVRCPAPTHFSDIQRCHRFSGRYWGEADIANLMSTWPRDETKKRDTRARSTTK